MYGFFVVSWGKLYHVEKEAKKKKVNLQIFHLFFTSMSPLSKKHVFFFKNNNASKRETQIDISCFFDLSYISYDNIIFNFCFFVQKEGKQLKKLCFV